MSLQLKNVNSGYLHFDQLAEFTMQVNRCASCQVVVGTIQAQGQIDWKYSKRGAAGLVPLCKDIEVGEAGAGVGTQLCLRSPFPFQKTI